MMNGPMNPVRLGDGAGLSEPPEPPETSRDEKEHVRLEKPGEDGQLLLAGEDVGHVLLCRTNMLMWFFLVQKADGAGGVSAPRRH